MTYKRKLIEVALPLPEINDASAYDKMPGIGPHPKGIHHWWARLPLPAARAMLFASLVTDPEDDPRFKGKGEKVIEAERERLDDIIRALLQKKPHTNEVAFQRAAQEIEKHCDGKMPTVLDPFSGGGTIPLEGQRLGLKSMGWDLNPVAILITKAQIEVIPKFLDLAPVHPSESGELEMDTWRGARGLAEDVRYYGEWMLRQAEMRIGNLYPKVKLPKEQGGSDATVLAWLWARTVKCPNPACGAEMPLVRSFHLSTKKGKASWVQPQIKGKSISYSVQSGTGRPASGTTERSGARCLCCASPVPFDYVRAEGRAGRIRTQLLSIVAEGARGRVYVSPSKEHETIVEKAVAKGVPDTDLPAKALSFRVQIYGMTKHKHLFTPRQLVTLTTLSDLIPEMRDQALKDAKKAGMKDDGKGLDEGGSSATAYADSLALFLSLAIDRCADFGNSLCRWSASNEKVMNLFNRQAIPMVWDFAEANMLVDTVGGWPNCADYVAKCIEVIPIGKVALGSVQQLDAAQAKAKDGTLLVSTDPPYYDNIGYADLSDFFYVWLRRSLGKRFPQIFSTLMVPKGPELVATPYRFDNDKAKAKEHFETGFRKAFTALKAAMDPRFPLTVYYAFKQSEDDEGDEDTEGGVDITTGWETLLESLMSSGFQITATWPIRASQKWRMVSMGTNALASYIVLACRARPDDAPLSTRKEFLSALKRELPAALRHLQHGNIAPVDLAQAAIGPGMAVFSRYSKVVEADGSAMSVRTALGIINQILDETLSEQEGDFDADTRWALDWFQEFGMNPGEFGRAETLATAKAIAVSGLAEAGILHSRSGKVRLLKREELEKDWDPKTDKRITIWEITQHLIRALETGGEKLASELLRQIGGLGDTARELSYRLFLISERKGWPQEALAYNSLVVAWPEIKKLASGTAPADESTQPSLL